MKTLKKILSVFILSVFLIGNLSVLNFVHADEPEQTWYNLIIHYVDSKNRSVAPDFVQKVAAWENYNVESPALSLRNMKKDTNWKDYFAVSQEVVNGTMPNNDVVITVIYKNKTPENFGEILNWDFSSPYDEAMSITTYDQSVSTAINWWDVVMWENGATLVNAQVNKIIWYVIDVFIVIWIAVAFIWWYKIMTSDKEESLKEWIRLIVFGIIWIIIMVSARFIASSLVGSTGIIRTEFANDMEIYHQPNWVDFSDAIYNRIMFPFIKIALYFVVWILFFAMVAKVISFVTATDDAAKKKAGWVIIWCVIWILIVMWSKQIVEAVIWNQNEVLNNAAEWVSWWEWGMWEEILDFGSIPIIAQIINWVMWLTMLAIVVLIIIQWYKIFTKPDDPKTRESLKKAILYILIWILVIGAAYVISNVLVVNQISIDTVTAS